MCPALNIEKVQQCSEWLQLTADQYKSSQSIGWYVDHIGELLSWMAFVNEQMAVAKFVLKQKKQTIYAESIENIQSLKSPSVVKDYIESQLSQDHYAYDLCERTSRTIYHTIEALRTTVSALKAELQLSVPGSRI